MSTAAISRFVLRHKLPVALAWLVVTIVAIVAAGPSTRALSQTFDLPGSESTEVNQAIARTYGNGGSASPLVAVVTLPAGTTADTPGVRSQLAAAFARVAAADPGVRIVSYASTGDRLFVSHDGRTTFGLIYPRNSASGSALDVPAIKAALHGANVAGARFDVTGFSELLSGGGNKGGTGVLAETLIGGLGALVVLAWVFGSFLALLPLLIAGIAILTTFLALWGVTTVTDVNVVVEFLIALIGLGVAIDYSLLVVTRWREERAAGRDNTAAVQRAMETAGHAVVFSGTAVAIGLCAMVVLPVPFLRSIGYGGMLIPLVSVVVTITLLPVLLATVGPRLDWPRLRRGQQVSRFWERWTLAVVRRRWLAAALALAILAALIVPAFSLRVGQSSAESLAKSGEAHDGLVELDRAGIGAGALTPYEVLVQGGDPTSAAATLGHVSGVRGAVAPAGQAWQQAGSALVVVVPTADASLSGGRAVLNRLRDAAHALPGQVRVGGSAAINADFIHAVYASFPLMLALIGLVTFVLLVRAFRSLLLPLKAIVLNALSVGAAYGVLVLVWQEGHGSHLIWGIPPTGAITNWLPLMVFSFLFGLSMDYEVFILTRMREEYDASGSTNAAVVRGMAHTGRLVSSAALILFLAFAALASAPNVMVKVMATGLAAGILLDATVIRALLVPAIVSLMGHWNWWLPTWLDRFMPKESPRAGHRPHREPASAGGRAR